MTKEQAIKHLKLMQSGARNAIRYKKNDKEISEEERKEDIEIYQDQLEALEIATKVLEQQSSDCVSLEVYKQVIRERDIASEQLKELGYELGEKIRTSDDCVSRKQAKIDVIPNSLYTSEQVIALLDNLSSVTPTQSWISVSERLPEESGNYLIYGKVVDYEENCVFIGEYDSDYEMFGYKEDIYDSETLGFLDSEFCEYDKVIAWQPLPKPYEEKRGDENEVD